ncbi:hypothetical protein FKR81_28325 [Lentzea tibetensis]|uniref:Uncharacterized protein n=1 Tax=Lentzea tibetensis TaxID=2591470 RepID=A0A563EMU7_9PSEU|nr:hypothetical protein [Lentzea tibetensis]TWP48497.1 hypothetical protein FKR81_28325 [Lentzea tibetensis]
MRQRSKALVAGAMALAMTPGLAGTADAGTGFVDYNDKPHLQITVWGQVWVGNDVTEWSLHARLGIRPHQQCVHLHLQVDRTLGSDPVYKSTPLCPGDTGVINFSSPVPSPKHSRTRGARLEAVWANGAGSREIIYVRE